jgi:hypothetical protein
MPISYGKTPAPVNVAFGSSKTVFFPAVSTYQRSRFSGASVGVGDFKGDGNADLVWENTSTGQRSIWFIKNGVLTKSIDLPMVPLTWRIADH